MLQKNAAVVDFLGNNNLKDLGVPSQIATKELEEFIIFCKQFTPQWPKLKGHIGFDVEGFLVDINGSPISKVNKFIQAVQSLGYEKFAKEELSPAQFEFILPEPLPISELINGLCQIKNISEKIHSKLHRKLGIKLSYQAYNSSMQPIRSLDDNDSNNSHYAQLINSWSDKRYQLATQTAGTHFSFCVSDISEAVLIHDYLQQKKLYLNPGVLNRPVIFPNKARKRNLEAMGAWFGPAKEYKTVWGFFQAQKSHWIEQGHTDSIDSTQIHSGIMIKPGRVEIRTAGSCMDTEKLIKFARQFHKHCNEATV